VSNIDMVGLGGAGRERVRSNVSGTASRRQGVRIRYLLPLAQMALATAIILWSSHWYDTIGKFDDSPGYPTPFEFLVIMSGPASLARKLWFVRIDWGYSELLFVASIGLCWYGLALIIDSWRWRGTLFPFGRISLRLTADALLIGMSVLFVGYFHDVNIALMPWEWSVPSFAFFVFWALAPILFSGLDIERCLHRRLRER